MSRSEVTDLIGSRWYSNRFPQEGTFDTPAVCYTLISNQHDYVLTGASGIATANFMLEIRADSVEERIAVKNALIETLDRFSGSWGSVPILNCQSEDDASDDELYHDDTIYTHVVDFVITYRETQPILASTKIATSEDLEASIVSYLDDLAPIYSELPEDLTGTAITYKRRSTVLTHGLAFASNVVNPSFEISVYGDAYGAVALVSHRIRERLQGLSGQMGGSAVWNIVLTNEGDVYSAGKTKDARYWNQMDFEIYVESA